MAFPASTLLKTKLRRPPLPRDAISRPRLIRRLNASPDAFLILIAAPAGAGKSTLVAQWLVDDPRPVAWLSLDSGDNDLPRFLQYMLAAIQSALPHACGDLEPLVSAPSLPPHDLLMTTLINSLAELPTPLLLVLDDLHTIRDPAILDLLNRLIEHRPEPLQVVITSRIDMPLRLSRLRAQGHLVELRLHDLRFTHAEIQVFGTAALHLELTRDAAEALEAQTEGWAAGLRLALLSLADVQDATEIVARLRSTSRASLEYLVDEVLARQSPATQRFLISVSFLDRLTAALCDSVLEQPASEAFPPARAILDELVKTNLFLIPLDAQGQWYRFHHLFREMLLERLRAADEANLRRLRRRAGDWFARHGLLDEALQYMLAAGDAVAAAQVVEDNVAALLNAEDRQWLERWLTWLPQDLIEQRPGLLMARLWLNHFRGRITYAPLLTRIETLLNDPATAPDATAAASLRAEMQVLASQWAYLNNQPQVAIDIGEQAVASLPLDRLFARGLAQIHIIGGLQALGRDEEIERRLAVENYRDHLDAYTSRLAIADILARVNAASWERCEDVARWLLKASQTKSFVLGLAWSHYGLGMASFERNYLDAAFQHFSSVADLIYGAHLHSVVSSLLALAYIHHAQGRPERADAVIEEADRVAAEANAADLLEQVRATRARLAVMRGDVDTALRLIAPLPEAPAAPRYMIWLESPPITRVRVWLAQGERESLARAETTLAQLLVGIRAGHIVRREIELLVLTALADEQAGRRERAVDHLGQAVQLAETRDSVRVFVEAGRPLVPLLDLIQARGVAPRFMPRLVAACSSEAALAPGPLLTGHSQRYEPRLVEPLTHREMDVLAAIARRRTNKEIAAELVISPATVQRHLSNIYQKLNAANRRDAVERARAQGILV